MVRSRSKIDEDVAIDYRGVSDLENAVVCAGIVTEALV
jgi:hypothetical protein